MNVVLLRTRAGRVIAGSLALLGVATIVGLVALWPSGETGAAGGFVIPSDTIRKATVTAVAAATCPAESRPGCQQVSLEVEYSGRPPVKGIMFLPGDEARPRLSVGDDIRVADQTAVSGLPFELPPSTDPSQAPYSFVDFQRGPPLLVLTGIFVILVIGLGRRVGTVSLIGAAAGLFLVTAFIAPAILRGSSPFLVALVGAFAAMFLSIVPLYGLSAKSLASLLGTAVCLALIGVLGVIAVEAVHLTGIASEEANFVQSLGGAELSLQGLVIAGILIGALGVLNDVTVGQASTVLALRKANPALPARKLYLAAMDVGRDHLGATVNTLVFAYAGASLPLLVIFDSQGISFTDAVVRETVATEIVAAFVGSIGLIAAVPLTTAAAALLAVRVPGEALGDVHVHTH